MYIYIVYKLSNYNYIIHIYVYTYFLRYSYNIYYISIIHIYVYTYDLLSINYLVIPILCTNYTYLCIYVQIKTIHLLYIAPKHT